MSESSIRRIYSIVPEDPSEIRPERFPSLKTFAGRSFARNLVRTLKQTDLEEFWNNEVWKIFRFQLFYCNGKVLCAIILILCNGNAGGFI